MVFPCDIGYDRVRSGAWSFCEIRSRTNTDSCHGIAVVCAVSQVQAAGAMKFLTNESSLGMAGDTGANGTGENVS